MDSELETGATAPDRVWLKRRRRQADLPPGSPCPNCETVLVGTYCHACGQMAPDFHKSIWALGREALENFFHLDGRLARTLPRPILRPGRLTRDYLDGRRAAQVPPLRMFLVVLVLAFVAGQCAAPRDATTPPPPTAELEVARERVAADPTLSAGEKEAVLRLIERSARVEGGEPMSVEAAIATVRQQVEGGVAAPGWLAGRFAAVDAEPGRFEMLLGIWAQRVALLALPLSALFLTGLFLWRRDLVVFDHLIFSMHSLTFQLLLFTVALGASRMIGPAGWWLLWLAPAHLFAHMRVAYGSGVLMTLARMTALFWLSIGALAALTWLWLFLAMEALG